MVKFIDEDIAQNTVAVIAGIALFHALFTLLGDKIATFKILFIIAGIALIVFSKKITKNRKAIDVFKLVGSIILFLGISPYLLLFIKQNAYIVIGIALMVAYFAKPIGKVISNGGGII